MNLAAIQHRAYDNFCYSLDDDTLEINLFTGKDVEKVSIIFGDPFEGGIMGGNWNWKGREKEVFEKKELQTHILWTTQIKPEFKRLRYYFKLESGDEKMFFLETGFVTEEQLASINMQGAFIFPWMNPCDTNKVPQWAQNTVWYQIFPARFAKGDCSVKPKNLLKWAEFGKPIEHGWKEPVYGGNIRGIIDRLDYLQNLGITGIYLTPINLSTSQHKYNTDDYETIDPEFGSEEDVIEMVKKAHERGIRVIFDGVFNHCGSQFPQWLDAVKNGRKSKYANWFMVNDYNLDKMGFGENSNSRKGKMYSFAFVDFMPKLNTNNPELRNYLLGVCEKWVKKYDIDGIRLDVANEISHVFCQELNKKMKSLKPDFYIVGEIWHNSMPWLRGNEFDSVMNYPLQNAIADFCCKEEWNSKQFEWALNRCFSMYYRQTNRVLFNQMDSHDTIRIVNRCSGNKNRSNIALALLFCMPGSVCIYYGTEIALEGGHDPDNRRCMPWKEVDAGLFAKQEEFTKKLISLRKSNPALIGTQMEFLYEPNDKEGKNRVVHIVKTSEDGNTKVGIIANCGKLPFKTQISNDKVLLSSGFDSNNLDIDGFVIYAK